MLKNNAERLKYLQDENNWINYFTVVNGLKLKISFLKDTNIVKVNAAVKGGWWDNYSIRYVDLGVYQYDPESGTLENVCTLSTTNLIEHIKNIKEGR